MKTKIILPLLFTFIFTSCVSTPKLGVRSQLHMGTLVALHLPERHSALFKPAFDHFARTDQALSTYKKNSEINKLNERRKALVSRFTKKSFQKAIEMSRKTDGLFNPGIGQFTMLHRQGALSFSRQKMEVPPPFHKAIRISQTTVELLSPKVILDFGAIGKGLGVDKVSSFLDKKKVDEYIIRASGDIRCKHRCDIFIRSPYDRAQKIGPFISKKENISVSTSGAYENYIQTLDRNHLIVPTTGTSQTEVLSITVFKWADNAGADALATALSVANAEKIENLAVNNQAGYFLILADGEVKMSQNIRDYVDFSDEEVSSFKRK